MIELSVNGASVEYTGEAEVILRMVFRDMIQESDLWLGFIYGSNCEPSEVRLWGEIVGSMAMLFPRVKASESTRPVLTVVK